MKCSWGPPSFLELQLIRLQSYSQRMQAKRTLWLLTLLSLTNYIDRWIIAAIMPPMQAELRLSNTQSGFVMSAFMLGYFLTSPIFGYLADRMSRIKLVMVGTGVWSFASGLSGISRSFTQIFLAQPREGMWIPLLSRDLVQRIVRLAKDMQIVIVSNRETAAR